MAAENSRVRQALDTCSTNVMIANADGHIIYMNHSVTQMMQRNEAGGCASRCRSLTRAA